MGCNACGASELKKHYREDDCGDQYVSAVSCPECRWMHHNPSWKKRAGKVRPCQECGKETSHIAAPHANEAGNLICARCSQCGQINGQFKRVSRMDYLDARKVVRAKIAHICWRAARDEQMFKDIARGGFRKPGFNPTEQWSDGSVTLKGDWKGPDLVISHWGNDEEGDPPPPHKFTIREG